MSGMGHRDASARLNTFLGIKTANLSNTDVTRALQSKISKYLYIEGTLITSENGKEAMDFMRRSS